MPSEPFAVDPNEPLPPHLDPRGRHHHRGGSGFSAFRILGRTVMALFSAALLLLAGYEWYTFQSINSKVTRFNLAHVGVAPSSGAVYDGKDQNILLVGNDDRSNMTDKEVRLLKVGRDGGSINTDTMMIVHVPADGSKATLISLPRDSYVSIPGYGMNKLNAAYSDAYNNTGGTLNQKRAAGADLLVQTVSDLTGLTIDHYIQVSLMGFYDIAQAIGGVPVNLCNAVDDTHAYNVAHGQDGGSGFKMSAGHHVLNAVQALEFVRQRHNLPLGDLDRVKRQQYFLTAAFRKVASIGIIFKLANLGTALERNVYMDKGLNLIDLAHQMEKLQANNILGKTIPFQGFDNSSPVGSVEIINPHRVQRWIAHLISTQNSASSSPSASSSASGSSSTSRSPSGSSSHKPLDAKCIN